MNLEYVDIFYSHRPDPETPLEETMGALAQAVHQGKALYVGISSYPADLTKEASEILKTMHVKCLIHQPKYSMFNRWVEDGLLNVLEETGIGCIPFSPLDQGLLTDKYLKGIPIDSRAYKPHGYLKIEDVTAQKISKAKKLNEIASKRNQSLAQMAVAWLLKDPRVTSVLIGVSKVEQLDDNLKTLNNLNFSDEELKKIELILKGE
jgi:L-glyceraldehyde 3-phosphate reductase